MNFEPQASASQDWTRIQGGRHLVRPSTFSVRRSAFRVSAKSAFTLLEIMVAIGLLAMVVLAIYASWNSILKGSKVALDAAAEAQRTRITMRTLHDSLLCACVFNANATNYTFLGTAEGDFSTLSFVARLPRAFPRSGKFGGLTTRRVQFTVENGNDNSHDLVLRQRPLIADFDKDEEEFPLILAHDVNKFLIEFVDPQSGDWISDWTLTNQMPTEVRITVGLGKLDQYSTQSQDSLVSIVAIPSVAVRQEYQVSGNGVVPGNGGVPGGQNGGAVNLNRPNNGGGGAVRLQ